MTDTAARHAAPTEQTAPPAPSPDQPSARKTRTARAPWRRSTRSIVRHVGLVLFAILMLYPLLWMVSSSLKPDALIFRETGLIPNAIDWDNYTGGWDALASPFGRYMINSAIVVAGSLVGNLLTCSMAAYAFARLDFRGKNWMFGAMLVTIMLPIHVVIVPQYILFSQIGWVNTFAPLIVPKFLATDAFFIFLMVQFIRGIPRELDEAARIDGAGHPRIFLQVILPLMTPALATTTIFTFIWTWSDFFSQLIYLTSPDVFTVPVALRSFVDAQSSTDWGSMFAMSVVSLLPVFIAFLVGQKFLVKGIATTGIK